MRQSAELRRQLSEELQPLDIILSLVVGPTEIAVRDAETLTSLVHGANSRKKVTLRVVRFFNTDGEVAELVGEHPNDRSRGDLRPFSRSIQPGHGQLLLPPVDVDALARRLAYVMRRHCPIAYASRQQWQAVVVR